MNDMQDYLWDTKKYNSYVRLRRDHHDKLAMKESQRPEIDFNKYMEWKLKKEREIRMHQDLELDGENEDVMADSKPEEEVMFEFGAKTDSDSVKSTKASSKIATNSVDQYLSEAIYAKI